MKTNDGVVITGQRVTLVPYEKEHVAKYHNWMKDPWLQEMTASEPLSLEEEFEMQKSWREDAKKCTFIVLAKAEGDGQQETSYVDKSAIRRMVGDVNLFFNDHDDHQACELEVMIAEEKYRRKGLAEEAVQLLMAYATATLSVSRFFCKIIETNTASLHLFDKLGYVKYNHVAAFKQVEMELVTRDKHAKLVDAVLKSAVVYTPHFVE
uniref:N-acetyltransferase domain-containing protein n=1 Tax=Peronospora matthiolae TaxID=2874970 RepID=A0AAV1U8Q7_9STRA